MDIDDIVATETEIKMRLGQLGEMPCDRLCDKDNDLIQVENEEAKRHIAHFNQIMVDIMRASTSVVIDKKVGAQMQAPYLCRRHYREGHQAHECYNKDRPCEKCRRMGHFALACGLKCGKCG